MSNSVQGKITEKMNEGTHKANTPIKWVKPVAQILGGFDLDPCASPSSDLARKNIRGEGGLEANWSDYRKVWVNHPFADPGPWLKKAVECDSEIVVTLSKGDPSTEWFNTHSVRAEFLCFPATRIKFNGYDYNAAFPTVYGVYGEYPEELRDWFESIGWVTEP